MSVARRFGEAMLRNKGEAAALDRAVRLRGRTRAALRALDAHADDLLEQLVRRIAAGAAPQRSQSIALPMIGGSCWAYCLMPNHVHLILVPSTADGLARAIGETHRQYTGFVNARSRWTGHHLFQGRFSSVVQDEEHLMLAARTIALNQVRARLVQRPQDWAWSSLRAHLDGRDDSLVTVAPFLGRPGSMNHAHRQSPNREGACCIAVVGYGASAALRAPAAPNPPYRPARRRTDRTPARFG